MLTVRDLTVSFRSEGKWIQVTDSVSFTLETGGTLGIVGESGCGKSVTAQALIGLLDPRTSRVSAKALRLGETDLSNLDERGWRGIRGKAISMVFQNPMTSLNPTMPCGKQIQEAIRLHQRVSRAVAKRQSIRLLEETGIAQPDRRYRSYPHELSGGMRQRVMIAMALACRPQVLIADEPTTALDVTIQAQILELIRRLQRDTGMGMLLITHDLGIVRNMVDRLVVMYAGQIVEAGPTRQVLSAPLHPYTKGLLESIPDIHSHTPRLPSIEGVVPSPAAFPSGCRFHPRCRFGDASCRSLPLEYRTPREGRETACQYFEKIAVRPTGVKT